MTANNDSSNRIVNVVLTAPTSDGIFSYIVPDHFQASVQPGTMVVVPFKNDFHQGIVTGYSTFDPSLNYKQIQAIVDEQPMLTSAQLQLAEILAERSFAPLNACINVFLTEKIRNISEKRYQLTNKTREEKPRQIPFFTSDEKLSLRNQLVNLFDAQNPVRSEEEIQRVMGKTGWKKEMEKLIREGIIRAEKTFSIPETSLKKERIIKARSFLSPDEIDAAALGRTQSAVSRRIELFRLLQNNSAGIRSSHLRQAHHMTRADLVRLKEMGLVEEELQTVWRASESVPDQTYLPEDTEPTAEQSMVLKAILETMRRQNNKTPALIQGITGSGKTEIYLRLAAETLKEGGQVLLLVPEIALTPQITARFEKRFPDQVGLYHSKLSEGERYDTWYRGRNGTFQIIIGPRSALAVPLTNLKLIIVDECHDDSYYQFDSKPYFSAVQCASDYAQLVNAQLVLGSATPTIAQRYKAEKSGWNLLKLTRRASGVPQPQTLLVDMRQELKAGNRSIFSRVLIKELDNTLRNGKQSILFLNRRGTAGYTFCHSCGHNFRCPSCDIPLTWHQASNRLQCHFCGHVEQKPTACPTCSQAEIYQFGTGIEQVETHVRALFPAARIIRMDSETTAKKGAYDRILKRFLDGEADILIGTKMVSKGLDLPAVQLVGVVLADVGIGFHDYRVDEQTFQLLTQVSGRAGRQEKQGLAILQTFQPDRYSIQAAVTGNYDAFYQTELRYRRTMGYPPFSRIARILIQRETAHQAQQDSNTLAEQIKEIIRHERRKSVALIGPAPCFFPRIRGRYRWHIILRGAAPITLLKGLDLTRYRVEIDPPNVL